MNIIYWAVIEAAEVLLSANFASFPRLVFIYESHKLAELLGIQF